MDPKLKLNLADFYETKLEQVGDLATWINAPQRKYHRHEFLGLNIASLILKKNTSIQLRDIGYGGVGLLRNDEILPIGDKSAIIEARLKILDLECPVTIQVRHATKFHVGCEFIGMTLTQQRFLQQFIQFMDGALQVRQVHAQTVFPQFSGRGWLNLAGHQDAIRFNIRFDEGADSFEANLIYVFNGQHRYGSWAKGEAEFGVLNGPEPALNERKELLRQVICMLIGIRQGSSLPGFEPLTKDVMSILDLEH